MQNLGDTFGQVFRAIWASKLRSFLTMFGIAWGVGSLLLLVGLGEGFRSGQARQLATLGQDIMFVFSGRIPAVAGSLQSGQTYHFTMTMWRLSKRRAPCGRFLRSSIVRTFVRSATTDRPVGRCSA